MKTNKTVVTTVRFRRKPRDLSLMSNSSQKSSLISSEKDRRQRAIELHAVNETKIWALMWSKMSTASQSKVREDPKFELARHAFDSVRLWKFIR